MKSQSKDKLEEVIEVNQFELYAQMSQNLKMMLPTHHKSSFSVAQREGVEVILTIIAQVANGEAHLPEHWEHIAHLANLCKGAIKK